LKNGVEKQVSCGKAQGRRSRGRQTNKYIDSLNYYVTNKLLSYTELVKQTDNRKEWRAMIDDDVTPEEKEA